MQGLTVAVVVDIMGTVVVEVSIVVVVMEPEKECLRRLECQNLERNRAMLGFAFFALCDLFFSRHSRMCAKTLSQLISTLM